MLEFGGGNVVGDLDPTDFALFKDRMERYMKRVSQAPLRGMADYRGIVFGPLYNLYWMREDVVNDENPWNGYFNNWDPAASAYDVTDGAGRYRLAYRVVGSPNVIPQTGASPQVMVPEIALRLATACGFAVSGDLFTDLDLQRLCLVSNKTQDPRYTELTTGEVSVLPEETIVFSRYLPDVSCAAFLRALHTTLFIAPSFDFLSGNCELVDLGTVLSRPAKDWTAKAGPILEQDAEDFEGFTLKWTVGGMDEAIQDYIRELKDVTLTAEMTLIEWVQGAFGAPGVPPIQKNAVTYVTDLGVYMQNRNFTQGDDNLDYLFSLPLQDKTFDGYREWVATARGFMTREGRTNSLLGEDVRTATVDMDATADLEEIVFANYAGDYPVPGSTGDRPALNPQISGYAKTVGGEERGIEFDWARGAAARGADWIEMLERNKFRKLTMDMRLSEYDILGHRWHTRVQIGASMYMIGRMRPSFPIAGMTRVELYYVG
jgi:hypothetical protein